MLGIALGSFAEGFQTGRDIGEKMRAEAKQQKQKQAFEGIYKQGEAAFQTEVQAGAAKPEDFTAFMEKHMYPKLQLEALKNQDIDTAEKFKTMAESAATKEGDALWGSALTKLNLGDINGAVTDMTKASKVKGYLPDGYSFNGYKELKRGGELIGYEFAYTTPDGETHSQPVPKDQVGTFLAGVFDPKNRLAAQEAAAAAAKEKEAEVATELFTYEEKKKIDKLYPDVKSEQDYEKLYNDTYSDLLANDLSFRKKSDAEKQAEVVKVLLAGKAGAGVVKAAGQPPAATPGTQAAPAAPGTVEKGEPVPPPGEAPEEETPAETAPVSGIEAAPQGVDTTATTYGIEPNRGGQRPQAAAAAAPTQQQAAIVQADAAVKQGGNPVTIAQQLVKAGVQPRDFPPSLVVALQKAKPGLY